MFFDVVDMATTYMQYLALLFALAPESLPDFYVQPFSVVQQALLNSYASAEETLRYTNPLRITLPPWFPLDIRLQFVCIAIIGPLALSTIGLLFVYSKPAYVWLTCLLATLFMFLFGFTVLANADDFTFPGSSPPSTSALAVLGGLGLPLFLLLLAVGLLGMGQARLRHLRHDAVEMERQIAEERERRQSQRVTQQMVDREGIDIVAVAAERVYAARQANSIVHLDKADVAWQGAFVVVLLLGSFVLLGAIPIPSIEEMQKSVVFLVLGGVAVVVCLGAAVWWVMSMFQRGRKLLHMCSGACSLQLLSLVMMITSLLYISVVTNFISIVYCVPLTCRAGLRMPHASSLFPSVSYGVTGNASDDVIRGSSPECLSCDFAAYPQQCPAYLLNSLCTTAETQSRLVYDTRVPCNSVDGFYRVSGILVFLAYILFLPYLQFYMAQYGVRVLQDVYPLERRYRDVFSAAELYYQKVLSSNNSAAFAYRAYKPQFRFYRLSFLLQKIVLGVVGCIMKQGQRRDVAWVGMVFFLLVPLIALVCSVILQPFARPTETIFFPSLQAMVSVCSIFCLVANHFGTAAIPDAVWVLLLIAIVAVPVVTLIAGSVIALREERRWDELLQKRLVEGVTAAYAAPEAIGEPQRVNSLSLSPLPLPAQRGCSSTISGSLSLSGSVSGGGGGGGGGVRNPLSPSESATLSPDSGPALLRSPQSYSLSRESASATLHPGGGGLLSPPFSASSALSSPPHRSRHAATEAGRADGASVEKHLASTDSGSTATTASSTATTAPQHRLPALLQRQTWWGSLKACGVIATEVVAAPFLLFRSRAHRHYYGVHAGIETNSSDGDDARAGGVPDSAPLHRRSKPVAAAAAAQRLPAQPGRRLGGAGDAAVLTNSSNSLTPPPQSLRRRHSSSSASASHDRLRSQELAQLSSGTITPRRQRHSVSLSAPTLGSISAAFLASESAAAVAAGTATSGALPPVQLARRGSAPPIHPLSPSYIQVPATLGSSQQLQLSPTQARSVSPTRRTAALRGGSGSGSGSGSDSGSGSGRRRRQRETDAATAVDAVASEYTREANEDFIPSQYFATRAASTWWFTRALPYLRHRWRRNSDGAITGTATAAAAAAAAAGGAAQQRHATSLTRLMARVPLPWQRQTPLDNNDTFELDSPSPPRLSLSYGAGSTSVPPPVVRVGGQPRTNSSAASTDGAREAAAKPSRLRQTFQNAMRVLHLRHIDRLVRRGGSGGGGAAHGASSAVLSFAEVYVRRQLVAGDGATARSGLERLQTTRERQRQRREAARRGFWGNPTDAMLGVVDVPGSMPPWGLYCSTTAATTTDTAALPPHERPLSSLQQQYYAQLMAQHREAGAKKQLARTRASGGTTTITITAAAAAATAAGVTAQRAGGTDIIAREPNSLLTSPVYTSLTTNTEFRLPMPEHPVRAAAREQHANALRRQHDGSGGLTLVPLDTEMREPHVGHARSPNDDHRGGDVDGYYHGHHVDVSADLDAPQLSSDANDADNDGGGVDGRLHWLQRWGPVLTELLYEAARDDSEATASARARRTRRGRGGDSDSDSDSDSSGSGSSGSGASTRSGSTDSSTSSHSSRTASRRVRRSSRGRDHQRRSRRDRGDGWLRRLLLCGSRAKAAPRQQQQQQQRRRQQQQQQQQRGRRRESHSSRADGGHISPRSPPVMSRQASTLLSIIMGDVSHVGSASTTSLDRATASTTSAPQALRTEVPGMVSGDTASRHLSSSPAASDSPTTTASSAQRRNGSKGPLSALQTPAARAESPARQSPTLTPTATTAAGAVAPAPDPLTQQLRCLFLVRERLKETFWERHEQLTAVQLYIDREVDAAVRRVLSFLFIVLGVVSTMALSFAICGMLHTVDWTFIDGVRRDDKTQLRYELAGYSSWDAFTHNCCCTGSTSAAARYPYYATDVENWVCANGVTKERVRRDGYDDVVYDGYSVRALCGMSFKNSCTVAVDLTAQTAVLTGCDQTAVTAAAMARW